MQGIIKPIFKNPESELETLYNYQAEILRELQILKRGKPIALAKARTQFDELQIRRKYNKEIAEKEKQAQELSAKIESIILKNVE